MHKRLGSTGLLLLLSVGAWSIDLHVEVSSGLLLGQVHEIVYVQGDPAQADYNTYLSELVWPRPLSATLGLKGKINWSPNLWTQLDLGGSVALMKGTMTDSDWNVYLDADHPLNNVFSATDAFLLQDVSLQLEQGWAFAPESPGLSGLLGVQVRQLAWESWTGSQGAKQIWTPIDTTITPVYYDLWGMVITYRQISVAPYLGLQDTWYLAPTDTPGWAVTGAFRLSPFLYVASTDFHVASKVFFDQTLGGFQLEPRVELVWKEPRGNDWGLRLLGTYAAGARGNDVLVYVRSSSPGTLIQNIVGSAWEDCRVELFMRN
ncbi:MAG: omptin family outer membrane protease [Spirochaetales bacterium]